jgi:hypothetical protein
MWPGPGEPGAVGGETEMLTAQGVPVVDRDRPSMLANGMLSQKTIDAQEHG